MMATTGSTISRPVQTYYRRADPFLAATLLLGALLRTLYALPTHVCFGDESFYLWLAQNLFSGEGYTYYNDVPEVHFPPLFPIALGLFNVVVQNWEVVSRVAYVVFGTALIFPVYLLASEAYSRRLARIAAFITALLPAFTAGVLFAESLSEPLYLLCLFSGIYHLYRAFSGQAWRSYAFAGAAFSLAYLTRPEGCLYFFLALASLSLYTLIRRPFSFWQGVGRLGILAGSFLLLACPYLIYVHQEVGRWLLTTKGVTTYLTTRGLVHHDGAAFLRDTWGLNDEGEVHFYAHDFEGGVPQLLVGRYRHRLIPDIKANLENAYDVLLAHPFFGKSLLFLALLGIFGSTWNRERLSFEGFQLLMLTPLTSFLIFFIHERYLYPLLLPLVLWLSVGVEHLLSWIVTTSLPRFLNTSRARRVLQVGFLLLLGAYLAQTGYRVFVTQRSNETDIWELTAALKKHTPADAIVLCPYPQYSFHAQRRWLPLPIAPLEDVLTYGKSRGATYLALGATRIENRPEEQRHFLQEARDRPGLELLASGGDNPKAAYVIYRMTD